jgi:hypothetical protein
MGVMVDQLGEEEVVLHLWKNNTRLTRGVSHCGFAIYILKVS